MYVRNWEDFVRVDDDGFIVQQNVKFDASGVDLSTLSANLGVIEATATVTPGTLDGSEEADVIAINLVAGQTYSFDYRGIVDPYLVLFNSAFDVVAEDDDGGAGRGSLITYTATTTGTHYIYATSYYTIAGEDPSVDAGDYTIAIWQPETDVPGTTNVLGSLPTAEAISLGTYYGNIDAAGDNDYFKIDVVAGQYYSFSFAGGLGTTTELGTPGDTAVTLSLYRPDGSQIMTAGAATENSVSYFATENGSVYLRAAGFSTTTGGYTIDAQQIDLSTRDPLQSLNWDSADNIDTVLVDGVPTAYVYFGAPGENFGEAVVNQGWQSHQIDAVMNALQEYTPITGIQYLQTTDVSQAEFRMITVATATYGARFYPQDPAYGTQQGIGTFNLGSGGFGAYPQSLERGGFSYAVILHEFGHAHGIAHPHDTGGGSEVMLGVAGAQGSLGVYNLNQGVYTVMSYNDAWQLHPDGPSAFTVAGIDNGWSASLSAFDIAVLQARYGVHDHNTGDTVYALTDIADDANYQTIWDTGGTDTISYGGALDAQIDLTAATLDYTPTGGGVISFLYNPQPPVTTNSFLVRGGYTIANGVVVENATGGSGDDALLGNSANNKLTGNAGDDVLMGRSGNDYLLGGAGNDRAAGGDGLDVVSLGAGNDIFVAEIGSTKSTLKTGTMSVDIITDFNGADDLIDLSGLGQEFNFRGTSATKNVGDLTYKTYTSVNGAENALGFDIDGQTGASGINGPVTVVYGNTDGGKTAEFAIVLLNTSSVSADDFIYPTADMGAAMNNYDPVDYSAYDSTMSRYQGDYFIV